MEITPLAITDQKLKVTGILPDGVSVGLTLKPLGEDYVFELSPNFQNRFNTFVELREYQAELVIRNYSHVFVLNNSLDLTAKILEMDALITAQEA